jgi:hypothetical protein
MEPLNSYMHTHTLVEVQSLQLAFPRLPSPLMMHVPPYMAHFNYTPHTCINATHIHTHTHSYAHANTLPSGCLGAPVKMHMYCTYMHAKRHNIVNRKSSNLHIEAFDSQMNKFSYIYTHILNAIHASKHHRAQMPGPIQYMHTDTYTQTDRESDNAVGVTGTYAMHIQNNRQTDRHVHACAQAF